MCIMYIMAPATCRYRDSSMSDGAANEDDNGVNRMLLVDDVLNMRGLVEVSIMFVHVYIHEQLHKC